MTPEELIRELDERRLTAESQLTLLGGIGEDLEQIHAELEAQELTTPPLVRELEATQERARARKRALTDEIAQLQHRREAVERTSAELDQLRPDLEEKLSDLSTLRATAATWNDRVAELEAEVNAQVERIDALARELALLVDGASHTPTVHAVTEIHAWADADTDAEAEAEFEPTAPPAEAPSGESHLLFVPQDDSYDLVERTGPPPAVGESIELDGETWVVTKLGSSPLPFDERACVFFSAS
jgi:seryl-tRNA synthetase